MCQLTKIRLMSWQRSQWMDNIESDVSDQILEETWTERATDEMEGRNHGWK